MSKKIWWGAAFLAVIAINLAITTLMMSAQSKSAAPQFVNGFPMEGWTGGEFKPPLLTRDQLVRRDKSLQDIIDRQEITDLLNAFVFFHDTGNLEGMRSTFTKDGGISGGYNNDGKVIEGRGCIGTYEQVGRSAVDTSGRMPKDGNPVVYPFPGHSKNITTNIMIQLHGDTAELHAYYTRVQANVEGEPPVVEPKPQNEPDIGRVGPHSATVLYTGQYVADLRRTAEGWRFTRQWHINDWRGPASGAQRPCPARPSTM